MKVRCNKVVRRIVHENSIVREDSNHEMWFYVSDDIFQTVWIGLEGPPIFEAGKTYTLNEVPDAD